MKKLLIITAATIALAASVSVGIAVADGASAAQTVAAEEIISKASERYAEEYEPGAVQKGGGISDNNIDNFVNANAAQGVYLDANVLKNGGTVQDSLISIDWVKSINFSTDRMKEQEAFYKKMIQSFEDQRDGITQALQRFCDMIASWFK